MFSMFSTARCILSCFLSMQVETPFISLKWKRKVLTVNPIVPDLEGESKEWDNTVHFLGSLAGIFLREGGEKIYNPTFGFYLDFEQAQNVFGALLNGGLSEYRTDVDVLGKQRWLSINESVLGEYTLRMGYYGEGFLAFDLTREQMEKLSSSVLFYLMDGERG